MFYYISAYHEYNDSIITIHVTYIDVMKHEIKYHLHHTYLWFILVEI